MARVREYGVDETGAPSSVLLGCAIGDIIPHFGTTPPPGTLVCDGSEISRETYHELYEEIGALCGPGDGSTTFELPDLRGKWMMGADEERSAGAEVTEGLPNITGTAGFRKYQTTADGNIVYASANAPAGNAFSFADGGSTYTFADYISFEVEGTRYPADALNFNASNASSIYGASSHVTPASVAILPCIVYE